jgi:serine phosphatase RsbU (regulator of sigma subunit)
MRTETLLLPAPETIEFQQKLARVQSLLEAAQRIHATIRLEEVLESVLELAAKELEAPGAFFLSARGRLEARCEVYGRIPDDWTRWSERDCFAAAPLQDESGETAHLVIYRPEPLAFDERDFLEGLALQAAMAIRNAQQHERLLEWERIRRDLEAARTIQRSLFPQAPPEIDGYRLSFRYVPCYEVGGDYVDIAPLPDGRVMMVLADVAGKGLASALIGMTFRSSFRAMCAAGMPLEEMAGRLNTLHWREGAEARLRYVTAVIVRFDPRTRVLEAVNAGHNPAFLADETGVRKLGASGPPLGMLPERQYFCEQHTLAAGGRMLLYTDGLTEVFRGEEEFGEERLLKMMCAPPVGDFLDSVWNAIEQFGGGTRQTDDRTALYLCAANRGGEA